MRAIHIDHGLQELSSDWSERCERVAKSFDVPLVRIETHVARDSGFGLEAAARRARQGAMYDFMLADEIIAFAHHRDDQAETVLLKLLRGAGPEGVAAMRSLRRFGRGLAWRPLLSLPRGALRAYATHHQLGWIEDPSNMDTMIDRNYLRIDVLPRLRKRWADADASISQSANWARAAAEYIEDQTAQALARVQGFDPMTLRYREWMNLPAALRDPVLRRWLREIRLPEPTVHQLGELVRQLAEAGEDKLPCVRWPGTELRRYRDLVYARSPLHMTPIDWEHEWHGESIALPADLGNLSLIDRHGVDSAIALDYPLRVRFRRGGESLRLSSGTYTRDLRDLFQEAGVPPWERGRLPLVIDSNGTLLAVGDLWRSDEGQSLFARYSRRLQWTRMIDRSLTAS